MKKMMMMIIIVILTIIISIDNLGTIPWGQTDRTLPWNKPDTKNKGVY
jgi:uncharacterized protein YxeA